MACGKSVGLDAASGLLQRIINVEHDGPCRAAVGMCGEGGEQFVYRAGAEEGIIVEKKEVFAAGFFCAGVAGLPEALVRTKFENLHWHLGPGKYFQFLSAAAVVRAKDFERDIDVGRGCCDRTESGEVRAVVIGDDDTDGWCGALARNVEGRLDLRKVPDNQARGFVEPWPAETDFVDLFSPHAHVAAQTIGCEDIHTAGAESCAKGRTLEFKSVTFPLRLLV